MCKFKLRFIVTAYAAMHCQDGDLLPPLISRAVFCNFKRGRCGNISENGRQNRGGDKVHFIGVFSVLFFKRDRAKTKR